VYEGTVTTPPSAYVSVFSGIGRDTSDRLAGPSNANTTTYTIHSVALDIAGAKSTARRVQALLTDWEPVEGKGRMVHAVSREPQLDREANPKLWYLVDQYDLTLS
jgi:hypothetical protein